MKKKWLAVVGVVMLVGISATAVFAGNTIKLFINGQEIKPDVPPQIINGRVMVPIRWVAEALGAEVEWDGKNRQVKINDGNSIRNESSSVENDVFLHNLQIEDWGNYDAMPVEIVLPENISGLSKEEKAKILEKLLAHSYSIIKNAVTKTGERGDYELWLNARYQSIKVNYVKFINLFFRELLANQPVIDDINTAYLNVLKTFEMPERPYLGISGFSGSMSKLDYNRILVLNKFGYYLSFGAKYYDVPGISAPKEYQDPASDFIIYDIPAISNSNNIIWGEGESPSQLDDKRIEVRKKLFELVNPYSGTITEGYIQKELVQKLGVSREEVDYLIDLYKDYQLRGNVPRPEK